MDFEENQGFANWEAWQPDHNRLTFPILQFVA